MRRKTDELIQFVEQGIDLKPMNYIAADKEKASSALAYILNK